MTPPQGGPAVPSDQDGPRCVRFRQPIEGTLPRFLATDAFREQYLDIYRDLYETIYASGAATAALDTAVQAACNSGATVDESQIERLRTVITNRTEAPGRTL